MAVSMSDADYAALVRAAKWIESHAGVDAPEYAEIQTLVRVVEVIDRSRTAKSMEPRAASPRQRYASGHLRDKEAAERDRQAAIRDGHADDRDSRALLRGEPGDPASAYRERRMGATDRADAARDRDLSKADRTEAAGDRKAASADDLNDDDGR